MLGERFFAVMDENAVGFVDHREFLNGLSRVFTSSFDEKHKLVFDIYDFDNDGFISKDDITVVLNYLPIV